MAEVNGEHVCYSCGKSFRNTATKSAHVHWRIHLINNHGGKVISSICHAACDGIHTAVAS